MFKILRRLPLFNRVVPKETGEENAQRFITMVKEAAREERFMRYYRLASPRDRLNVTGWEWMAHEQWRQVVEAELVSSGAVIDLKWYAPGPMGDWALLVSSASTTAYVETLRITDSLDGA